MNLFTFGHGVDVAHGRGLAMRTPLSSVELGVGALDHIAQRQHRIEGAHADGRADHVRQTERCLIRDAGSESLADCCAARVVRSH
jgi:hypothetical protein